MLHRDTLIRLCQARDLLRDEEELGRSIPQVAREIGMSPYHFIRLFKAVFGLTPKQCQLHARLERAKRLLVTTDRPVTDICMETGFSSLGTFSYVFARRVGAPPSAYRRRFLDETRRPGEVPARLVPGCFSLMFRKI